MSTIMTRIRRTTVESIMICLIRRQGTIRIEHDRHVTGPSSLGTRLDLMRQAGFRVEKYPCRQGEDPRQALLPVGILAGR